MLRDEVKSFFDWFIENNINIINLKADQFTIDERQRRIKSIEQKDRHSNRVANSMINICKSINFNKNSIQEYLDLAWIIGILHDIGRPLQMVKTGTYVDNDSYKGNLNFNSHGDEGAKFLFDEYGFANKFNISDGLKYIIEECIEQHGTNKITDNLTRYSDKDILFILGDKSLNQILKENKSNEIEMLTYFYLKILRDADKIDIYRQVISDEIPIYRKFMKYYVMNPETNKKDTYSDIAKTFNIETKDIFEANGITNNVDVASIPKEDIILIPTDKVNPNILYVPKDIFDGFVTNKLPFYRELQKRRDYNFLSASVVRLNFLWGFNSLEALKMIRAEDLLTKMFNNYPSEYQEKMRYVFEAAKTILDNRINEMEKKIN